MDDQKPNVSGGKTEFTETDIADYSDMTDLPWPPRRYTERRKKQDWVVRSVTIIAVLGWICAMVALLLIDRASPAQENLITRLLNVTVVSYWNTSMLRGAFVAVLASFVISIAGFFLNMSRHRRKTDKYNKLLITICILSTVIFVFYMVSFFRYL